MQQRGGSRSGNQPDTGSKRDVGRLLVEFRDQCRQHGLKLTPQRFAIYSAVKDAGDHPSAEMIYRKIKEGFPGISFDTVNRTLVRFAEIGIIDIVEGFGDSRRFDPNTADHHHLVCIKCKKIIDIFDSAYDEIPLSREIEEEFTVMSKRVVVLGICKGCNK